MVRLNQLLVSMVEKIAFELRKQEKLTSCVTVKIRYSNFDTHTLQKRIPYTSFDHVLADITKELFGKAIPATHAYKTYRSEVQPYGAGSSATGPV